MDEYKIEHISNLLFEHMVVGMIFFTHSNALTIEMVEKICKQAEFSKLSPSVAVADLVSHGIVSAYIDNRQNVSYKITEFGQYFFNTFCQTNTFANELCEQVRGYLL